MPYTVAEAAKVSGKSKPTILRAIRQGGFPRPAMRQGLFGSNLPNCIAAFRCRVPRRVTTRPMTRRDAMIWRAVSRESPRRVLPRHKTRYGRGMTRSLISVAVSTPRPSNSARH